MHIFWQKLCKTYDDSGRCRQMSPLSLYSHIKKSVRRGLKNNLENITLIFLEVKAPFNCGVRAKDEASSVDLLTKLCLVDTTIEVRTRRLRWFVHVRCTDDLSCHGQGISWKEGPG